MQPLGYIDNLNYIKNAEIVITDSGGIQKEAYWAGIPCYTLRNETEWINTVESGWNTLVSADESLSRIVEQYSIPEKKYLCLKCRGKTKEDLVEYFNSKINSISLHLRELNQELARVKNDLNEE